MSLPKTDLFKQATDFWNLERLYADLATVDGKDWPSFKDGQS
jgi:hypothetical protein